MKLASTQQMRDLEQAAVDAGATWPGLMEQAGWGVAQAAMRRLGHVAGKRVLVLVGPGNNGGDGLVVARHLHDAGAQVNVYTWRRELSSADANWQFCRQRGIPAHAAADDPDTTQLREQLARADLVIDALLGMGISRPVEGALAAIVAAVNAEPAPVLAIDLPTGVHSDSGAVLGSAIHATATVATGLTKRGLMQPPGRAYAGTIETADIGLVAQHIVAAVNAEPAPVLAIDLPTGVHSDSGAVLGSAIHATATVATGLTKRGLMQPPGRAYAGTIETADIGLVAQHVEALMSVTIDSALARSLLPARPADAHKGTFGKVMVIAGSALYPGAASLATTAAARVGAGVVTLANSRSALLVPGRAPEITLQLLPEADWNALGEAAADEALKHLDSYTALLVGPGLGREEATRLFLARLLGIDSPRHRGQIGFRIGMSPEKPAERQRPELPPTVIDADGLTLLSQIDQWWEHAPRGTCVLTPHPGEMKRLLGTEELGDDRIQVAEEAARTWGQIVVLKGATTVVAHPEGRTAVNDGGNPALATAGTGDVLAGAIAGLLAQGLAPYDAAVLGVYLHSAAGRLVRDEVGDMGALASDLLPRLPLAIKELKSK